MKHLIEVDGTKLYIKLGKPFSGFFGIGVKLRNPQYRERDWETKLLDSGFTIPMFNSYLGKISELRDLSTSQSSDSGTQTAKYIFSKKKELHTIHRDGELCMAVLAQRTKISSEIFKPIRKATQLFVWYDPRMIGFDYFAFAMCQNQYLLPDTSITLLNLSSVDGDITARCMHYAMKHNLDLYYSTSAIENSKYLENPMSMSRSDIDSTVIMMIDHIIGVCQVDPPKE